MITKPVRRFPRMMWGIYLVLSVLMMAGLTWAPAVQASILPQQPTVSIATVTGSPSAPIASVYANLNEVAVRTGPGRDYPVVGILVGGQKVPAVGCTAGCEWVQIVYYGVAGTLAWVYGPFLEVSKALPVITPPPLPTPATTPTLDPTLEARYPQGLQPTSPPTFTPPPMLVVPTFQGSSSGLIGGRFPMGFAIIGLAVVGAFGIMVSLLRSR